MKGPTVFGKNVDRKRKQMLKKRVRDSKLEMTQLMMPNDANVAGYVQGGALLSLIDKAAYACAARHSESYCVTASVDRVHFRSPIKVGHLVTIKASVNYVGRTSMEVGIKVLAVDPLTGEEQHTNSCYVTMVAVDAKGRPKPVSQLIPETPEEKRRYRQAEARRRERLKSKK